MTRSGDPYTIPRDGNRVPALGGVSSVNPKLVLPLKVNPVTGGLIIDGGSGGSSSVTYNTTPLVLSNGGTAPLQSDGSGRLLTNSAPLNQANDSVQAYLYDSAGVGIASIGGGLPVIASTATGSAVPANAHYIGIQNGSNLTGLGAFSTVADNNGGGAVAAMAQYAASNTGGTTVDKWRNNILGTAIAAGRTTSQTVTVNTFNARSLVILVNVASVTGGTLTLTINGVSLSAYVYPLLLGLSISTTGVTPYRIAPGLTPSPNAVANDVVPRSVQIVATATGTISFGIDYASGV